MGLFIDVKERPYSDGQYSGIDVTMRALRFVEQGDEVVEEVAFTCEVVTLKRPGSVEIGADEFDDIVAASDFVLEETQDELSDAREALDAAADVEVEDAIASGAFEGMSEVAIDVLTGRKGRLLRKEARDSRRAQRLLRISTLPARKATRRNVVGTARADREARREAEREEREKLRLERQQMRALRKDRAAKRKVADAERALRLEKGDKTKTNNGVRGRGKGKGDAATGAAGAAGSTESTESAEGTKVTRKKGTGKKSSGKADSE